MESSYPLGYHGYLNSEYEAEVASGRVSTLDNQTKTRFVLLLEAQIHWRLTKQNHGKGSG